MPSKYVSYFVQSICIVILSLALRGQLQLYIHPRYIVFTVFLILIGFILLFIDSIMNSNISRQSKSSWVVILVASLGVFIGPQSLSQQTASSRVMSSQGTQESNNQSSFDSFSKDLTRFDIVDWHNFIATSPSPEQISGKQAKVIGFIFADTSGQKYIARFQLTCCAVDAKPITVAVLSDPTIDSLSPGEWVEISGVFIYIKDSNNPYQIQQTSIEIIDEPREPYVY